jgi:hypothetical protein
MTVRFQTGLVKKALVLARGENVIRVAMEHADDSTEISKLNGVWITQDCEPVVLGHLSDDPWPDESDCICPPLIASQLIRLLYSGSDEHRLGYSAEEEHTASPAISPLM